MTRLHAAILDLAMHFTDRNPIPRISAGFKASLCVTLGAMTIASVAHAQTPPPMQMPMQQAMEMQNARTEWIASQLKDPASGVRVIKTGDGGMKQIQMTDGSTIWLNKDGKPHDFGYSPAVQYPDGGFEHFRDGRMATAPGSTLSARLGGQEIHLRNGVVVMPGLPAMPAGMAPGR